MAMRSLMKFVSVLFIAAALLISPVLMSASGRAENAATARPSIDLKAIVKTSASMMYDSLRLENFGLNQRAFEYAWKGFVQLAQTGQLMNTDYFTICDFSQSSRNKRLYIIDLVEMRVIKNTYVAHGRNSGAEYATTFSNRPESHKSSLGFYVTGETYKGQHGLSLKMRGVEKGINDKALARRIVIHGSSYIGEDYISSNPFAGRSYGCPAIPSDERDEIISMIKEGTCVFIYHPSRSYITRSKILNS
jgi:hypothetical protein